MHITPIAVEIISQNFQELLNFAGNIPLLTEKVSIASNLILENQRR